MRQSRMRLNVLAGALLAMASRSGCPDAERAETAYMLRAAHAGVFFFSQSRGRLPEELAEVCTANAGWCRQMPAAEWFRDGWGTPLRYVPGADSYVLASAGADRRFATHDDVVFDAAADRERAEQLAGCFVLAEPIPRLGTRELRLSTRTARAGGYRIDLPMTLDGDTASVVEWYPLSPESLVASWILIDRGLTLEGRVRDGVLEGRVGRGRVHGRRVGCEAA